MHEQRQKYPFSPRSPASAPMSCSAVAGQRWDAWTGTGMVRGDRNRACVLIAEVPLRARSLPACVMPRIGRSPARYAPVGGPNQVASASASPTWVRSPTQATYPSGLISTAAGAATWLRTGSSHVPANLASIN